MSRDHATRPVIVLGMHRSGTSMLVGLLRQLGLWIGHQAPRNNEARLFRRLNTWLIKQGGGTWDNPHSVRRLLEIDELRQASGDYLRDMLGSQRTRSYLGWRRWLGHRSLFNLDFPWGWKDPVNTFTLPFWLDLFPDARVVHIYRNGVDIAQSLYARTHADFRRHYGKWQRHKWYYRLKPLRRGFAPIHTWRREDSLQLWDDYMTEAGAQLRNLPAERTHSLRYESFLADPAPHLAELADFCGLQVDANQLRELILGVNPNRAFAFAADPELREFAQRHETMLRKWGYNVRDILAHPRG